MQLPPEWSEFLDLLLRHRVRFLLIGAHALAVHGRPRATLDLDVFVEPSLANAKRIGAARAAAPRTCSIWRCSTRALLELKAAIGARAVDERRRGPARRARQLVADDLDLHRCETFALDGRAPLAVQELTERRDVCLLDQEVRPRASTLAAAGRTPDERGDAGLEAALAQGFHVGDRSGDRRNERLAIEQRVGFTSVHDTVV